MSGLSVKLPLTRDSNDGFYTLNKDYASLCRQNLRSLILTNEGERIMDPLFGVGLKKYLFEPNVESVYAEIANKIRSKVSQYLPFIEIIDIELSGPSDNDEAGSHILFISLLYKIVPLDAQDVLEINLQP